MKEILSSPWFQIGGIPIVLMLVGVFAKRLGRPDGDDSPRINDWAVGTTILLMILGASLVDLKNIGNPSDVSPHLGWVIGILLTVFISIDHDRFRSWIRGNDGLPLKRKRLFVGVIIPDILSLVIFGFYQAQKIAKP